MNIDNLELTLLSEDQIWSNYNGPVEVFHEYGLRAGLTDLAILTGAFFDNRGRHPVSGELDFLKGRNGEFWTRSSTKDGNIKTVDKYGCGGEAHNYDRNRIIRPVIQSPEIFSQVYSKRTKGYARTEEVEFGEYPQYAPSADIQKVLEYGFQNHSIQKTGKAYTFDKHDNNENDKAFQPITYDEYEFQDKKYIRVKANSENDRFKLSNNIEYKKGDYVWVEVSPVVWLIDHQTKTLISKRGLLSGIRFLSPNESYDGDFEKTEMKEYLDRYMVHDLTQSMRLTELEETVSVENEETDNENDKTDVTDEVSDSINVKIAKDLIIRLNSDSISKEECKKIIDKYNISSIEILVAQHELVREQQPPLRHL